jgi:hypothetical protein
MADSEPIDSYFTRQIVGETLVVALGPGQSVQQQPEQGVWIDSMRDRAVLLSAAALEFWSGDSLRVIHGRPISPARFKRVRRMLVLVVLALWSVIVWLAFHALYGR